MSIHNDHINKIWACRAHCQETLFNYCIEKGGKHIDVNHIKSMTDCIQICQTTADFLTRNSEIKSEICKICAEICKKCSNCCSEIGDDKMKECAEICRECVEACEELSKKAIKLTN